MAQAFTEPLFAVPSRHELEDKAIILLREFYTIDEDIQIYREYAQGDNLPVEPRVTAFLRHDEDDTEVLWKMHTEVLTDGQSKIVNTVMQYVDSKAVTIATKQRVERIVSRISAVSRDDQETLDMFVTMLREAIGDLDDTRLNDIETLVDRRWKLIDDARKELKRLEKNKLYVGGALRQVKDKFPESYQLLRLRYVEDREVNHVCDVMKLMSKRSYDIARDNAMGRLLERLPRLNELECRPRKNGSKHKRGYPRAD